MVCNMAGLDVEPIYMTFRYKNVNYFDHSKPHKNFCTEVQSIYIVTDKKLRLERARFETKMGSFKAMGVRHPVSNPNQYITQSKVT